MEDLAPYLSVDYRLWTVFGWPLSLIELLGIVSGVVSVLYATRMNRLTWMSALVNEVAFFGIFYQVELYSDMLLQVFFALVTLYGWIAWGKATEYAGPRVLCIKYRIGLILGIALMTYPLGATMSIIHEFLPTYFKQPAASPYADACTTVASVVATCLLARKIMETWILWIVVDVVSIYLYFSRGIPFMGLLYVVFLGLASLGLYRWTILLAAEQECRASNESSQPLEATCIHTG